MGSATRLAKEMGTSASSRMGWTCAAAAAAADVCSGVGSLISLSIYQYRMRVVCPRLM